MTMAKLTLRNYRDHDPDNMFDAIAGFPDQIEEGVRLSENGPKVPKGRTRRVVILGMGGSAIGGDLLRSYVTSFPDYNGVEVVVNRDYNPPMVSGTDMLVVSSYSGNTEETLAAYNAARKKAGSVVVFTTGGKLMRSAKSAKYRIIELPSGLQPRAALGYSFFPLLHTLAVRTKLFGDQVANETEKGIAETVKLLRRRVETYGDGPKPANRAFRIAKDLHGKVPVIYSATERMDTVNLRWRGQIQENAKHLAFGNLIPEMNHNEINGWSNPPKLLKHFVPIWLRDREDHRRNQRRLDITERIIGGSVDSSITLEAEGRTWLARMFSLIHLGDWVSYWLAGLNGVDPSPVPVIEGLKKELG